MKKIKLVFASMLAATFVLASCSKDDDGPAATLEGKWTPTKTITIVNGGDQNVTNYAGNDANCDKDFREFSSGGQYREVILYQNLSNVCVEDAQSSQWTRVGDVLTITDTNPNAEVSPPSAGTYEITKLTGSELRYQSTVNNGSVEVEVTYVFKRL